MAIKIGITGGIGSGKSMVSRLLEVLGVPVYISDLETKRLMASDSLIREDLSALLGAEVYAGGTLNKPLLASYLFGSPEHAKEINCIVHPRVKEDFRRWTQCRTAFPIVGIESAILVEAGFAGSGCYCYGLCARRGAHFTCRPAGCFLARIDRKAYP